MKEQSGRILHFAGENRPVAGYTVSEQICHENGTGLSEHAAPGKAWFSPFELAVVVSIA